MKKFSRAALLEKKRWTGADVGQAYIYNLSIQAPGKAAEPIESATLRDKAAGLDFETILNPEIIVTQNDEGE